MKKRILALVMSLVTVFTACACGGSASSDDDSKKDAQESEEQGKENEEDPSGSESEYPEYLNMESTYPVIKDEYEGTIKLSVAVVMYSNSGEWEDLWVSRYLKDKYNIELEVEYILDTALAEKKNLMVNSGDLPDLMWNMNFTTEELVRYGMQEGLFLACDEYINETLTPHLYSYMTDEVTKALTTEDGHIYSLPYIMDETENMLGQNRYFINGDYLEAAELENPKTLDEFTETMYALKEADVTGVGSDNFFPIGGGMEYASVAPYLMQALGYNVNGQNYYGLQPALRNGEVVIPVYDMDVYKEFLTLMNQYYKDGIINPNYFTIESTESDAQLQSRKTAVYGSVVYTTGLETWSEWDACYPLSSEWNDTPIAYNCENITVGGYVISADTEYPELCMRLADIFYDVTDNRAFWSGTGEGTEYDYDGYVLGEWLPDKNNFTVDQSKLPEGYTTWTYFLEYVHGTMLRFGSYTQREAIVNIAKANGGDLPYDVRETYDVENTADHQWRAEWWDKVYDYVETGYPTIYYLDEAVANEITDLSTVIEPYAKEQVALFITGGRDLAEVDDFVKELESMGMNDLLNIYKDIYNNR